MFWNACASLPALMASAPPSGFVRLCSNGWPAMQGDAFTEAERRLLDAVAPAVADEYVAAKAEVAQLGQALGLALSSDELGAFKAARAMRGQVVRIAVRWAKARKGLR